MCESSFPCHELLQVPVQHGTYSTTYYSRVEYKIHTCRRNRLTGVAILSRLYDYPPDSLFFLILHDTLGSGFTNAKDVAVLSISVYPYGSAILFFLFFLAPAGGIPGPQSVPSCFSSIPSWLLLLSPFPSSLPLFPGDPHAYCNRSSLIANSSLAAVLKSWLPN